LPSLHDVADQIRWQDIADVLILTFVVYRLTLWLRGTVAFQVLAGMLALAAAAFAADEMGLLLTAYLLRALGAIATLVAVVVFRNEIRRALRRFNPVRWWRDRLRRAGAGPPAATADTLAAAAFAMARRRLGALFVVRNVDALDEHLTGGVALNAQPSVELIESLFHLASPLHDGAVTVEDGRLTRAGCFLPLSTSLALPDSFGTRHRAAAGMTEVSDATVVASSEERGVVTLFSGRTVEPMPDEGTLAARLRAAGADDGREAGSGRERRRARRFHALALLGSFLLVVGAWYAVVGEPGSVVTHTVSVELRSVPEDLEADPPSPDRVAVNLRGPRTRLDSVGETDVQAWVDLGNARPGLHRLPLAATAPPGVEVGEIVPRHVFVQLRERR
jgi:diadenylate cyclase